MRARVGPGILVATLALSGCRTAVNYPAAGGPRYRRAAPAGEARAAPVQTLRIVSFNIEMGLHVDGAIRLLQSHQQTRSADLILLQEMDDAGTRRVAEAFDMGYVYYPADLSLTTHRDFGNAVLSRWPIVEDAKIALPHLGVFGQLQRIATAATLDVGGTPVRVYSVHLGTLINVTAGARRDQLRTVLADARRYPHVVIAGDLNSHGVGHEARRQGSSGPRKTVRAPPPSAAGTTSS